jgi:hypothetical protein
MLPQSGNCFDAKDMALPLLGYGTHDWNFLLTKYNLLDNTSLLQYVTSLSGFGIIICAFILGITVLFKQNQKLNYELGDSL